MNGEAVTAEVVELTDVDAFRQYKRRERGVIVTRRSGSSSSIHHPACPHVREDAFLEKLANLGAAGYYWVADLERARRRWPLAHICAHPSDPLAGGTGGSEATQRAEPTLAPEVTAETWEVAGPDTGNRSVRAFADRRLQFPYKGEPSEQYELRQELQRRLSRLAVRDDELLHAYFGAKPRDCDVENLLLYNVHESLACLVGGARALRFELATKESPRRACAYVYRPRPRSDDMTFWQLTGEHAWSVPTG
jgi:hypothetical protein